MKIKVPFVKRSVLWRGRNWCGPLALASLLKYYRDKTPIKNIVKEAGTLNQGTLPRGLAFFCLLNDFKVDYVNEYSEHKINRKEYSERFRKFLREIDIENNDKIFRKKCKKFSGYKSIKKRPTLKQIEKYLDKKKPILVYLNIAVVCEKKELWPHYVLVVGYDEKNFYVHNTYPRNKAYQKISKEVFAKAWSSDGMDPTLIIPSKRRA